MKTRSAFLQEAFGGPGTPNTAVGRFWRAGLGTLQEKWHLPCDPEADNPGPCIPALLGYISAFQKFNVQFDLLKMPPKHIRTYVCPICSCFLVL